jgi:molecular chaperone HtpG
MKPDQQEIYYLTGESRTQAEQSPHLEAFQAKGYEVLYFVHPIEEIMAQSVREFDGKKLKSISKGQVSLGDDSEKEVLQQQETENAALLQFLQKSLDSHVKEVKLSNRLTTSPVCLTNAEHEFSPHLERLLQQGQPGMPRQRRIMELNPKHDLFQKLQTRFQQNAEDPLLLDYAELLLGYGLIAEGSDLVDPGKFNRLVANLMLRGL